MYADESRAPIVLLPPETEDAWSRSRNDPNFVLDGASMRQLFREFFRNFRLGTAYIYRDSLIRHWNRNEYYIDIDLAHINEFSESLFNALQVLV